MRAEATPPDVEDGPVTDFERRVWCVLGLPFDAVSVADTVALVREAAAVRRRCFLSTPNLNFAIGCMEDEAFRRSVLCSDLSVVDGMPLVWIARAFGLPLPERVSGASVFEALRAAHRPALRVYFFGGPDGAAEAAARRVATEGGPSAGIVSVGYRSPGFGSIEELSDDATIDAINETRPDLVVVALGARKGQAWIERSLGRLTAPVVSHLGAVVNLSAGTMRRAPPLWQRLGFEWLWRIGQEPHLWRRYWDDGSALSRLLVRQVLPGVWDARRRRPTRDDLARATLEAADDGARVTIVLRGAWTVDNLAPLRRALTSGTRRPADLTIDLDGATFVDSACVALLLLARGHQAKVDRLFEVRVGNDAIRRRLRHHGTAFLYEASGLPP